VIAVFGWAMIDVHTKAQEKAKHSIKDVMQKAHKGGLMKKVAEGKATDAEKKELVEFYEALAANKPPKGDDASWKTKTAVLIAAAKAVAEGKEGAGKTLLDSVKCMDCHSAHKGK
jgi:hypothetical protein